MRKTLRRILASLLTAVMLLTAAPLSGFVGLDIDFGWLDFGTKALALDSSGSCGRNVTYTFDSTTGLLTISGTGDMYDCFPEARSTFPFYNNSTIKNIVINSGVTSIGDEVFEGCTGLVSIKIPNSVTSIGDDAFNGCTGLTSIKIPNSVTSIGISAFNGCTGLISITIPDSVTSIGHYAFNNTGYYNNTKNWEDNVLYIGNHLISANFISGSYAIKSGTKTIADSAFDNETGLTSVTIPDSVTSIGDEVFEWCTGLVSIKIPDSVTSIGDSAFNRCTGLTSVTIPDSVTSIGYYAFNDTGYYNNTKNWEDNVLYIGNHLIEANNEISGSYTIKSGTKTIARSAFYNKTGLTSVTIPDSVTVIGGFAFSQCYDLINVTIGDGVTRIGKGAFFYCKSLTNITIPDSVTSIGDSAFDDCKSLTNITIPDSVISIDSSAFRSCTGLTSITIPDSVISIGDGAFLSCTGLTSITVDSNNPVYDSRNNCNAIIETQTNTLIQGCRNTIIPKSVTSIGDSAFDGCKSLTNITIPDSVTSIGNYTFYGCTSLTSITIPNSVTSIGYYAFSNCSSLTSIVIPDSVTSIGKDAFSYCTGLTSVKIPDSVTSIDISIFGYCTGLTSIIVDSNNPVYDSRNSCNAIIETQTNTLIQGCRNTIIPKSVTSIGNSAFSGCKGLTSIKIPDSVTSIGNYAFSHCTGLTGIVIPDSVISIGSYAFLYCAGLKNVTISDSVTSLNDGVFFGCSGLTYVTIPDGITSIGRDTFCDCDLRSVIIPNSVTSIGDSAFVFCSTIYGFTGSAAETYANKKGIDFVPIDDTPDHNCVATVTDKNSGISLEFPAWAYNGDVTLKVEEVLSGSSFDIIGKVNGKSKTKVFTIETYVDSESVQPNGEVTVKIPVPDGFNAEKCKLYYLNASSKKPEEIAITIKDGYIVFKTNHFSDWAIVQFADLGDVNEDSKINSSDALLVLRHSTGLITLSDSKKLNADVARDGKINSTDALRILQYSTGLVTSF